MKWRVRYPDGQSLSIRWSDVKNVTRRIQQFRRPSVAVSFEDQAQVELYAEATYVKYRTARNEFAATANTFADWTQRAGRAEESLALLEAWTSGRDARVAGAILLRRAWTGDVVVDFVVANKSVAQSATRRLKNVGMLLVAAAVDVAVETKAPLVWAETASHSAEWWGFILKSRHNFVRFDTALKTQHRLSVVFRKSHVSFTRQH